ncbi:MAG: 5-formyltetrahydrofolate cyclo-ligase [Chromatiales bacterium]|nr:5-formyltetrahydrofolate cyclo-ligase [Gammaproteobacteria bacterium]MBW6477341.1 5-formyltetrahydrofolate cyclo-ligase [Chromatiales bacterium]
MTNYPDSQQQARQALRRQMRQQRRALSPAQRQQAARQLLRHFASHPAFLHSQHIAFYLPNDGELDLRPLIEQAWSMGKHCYLPVLSPLYHNRLWFAPYRPDSAMIKNRFGILEPSCSWRRMRPVWALDLVLTPLVAFDQAGNRLGMGGGYYDRSLAYLARRQVWKKPRLIGAAYTFQSVATLPSASWDVPLHGIVTEQCLQSIR